MHRFGAHLSIAGGVHHALEAAQHLRCDALQLFVKNQRQWNAPPLRDDDVVMWHTLRQTAHLAPLVAHATYLINLASPDRRLYRRSVTALTDELRRCDRLGIACLVVHPGSGGDDPRTRALARVSRAINEIYGANRAPRTQLLLESTAGAGRTLGRTFEELGAILAGVAQPERVGICLDTCHLFAAGYDLRDAAALGNMLAEAERCVGLERIRCWHLNDSRGECGSRLDRHAHIGRGLLGSAGFVNVLAEPRFDGLPMILETPKGLDGRGRDWDRVNLQRLRALATRALRLRHARNSSARPAEKSEAT